MVCGLLIGYLGGWASSEKKHRKKDQPAREEMLVNENILEEKELNEESLLPVWREKKGGYGAIDG
jgi:hypothetical protein